MTSDIGAYEQIRPHHGNVGCSLHDKRNIPNEFSHKYRNARNTHRNKNNIPRSLHHTLNCILPDNHTFSIGLTSVLYVPSLGHSLVSWNVLKSKDCVMKASGDIILVPMGISGVPVLMAKFIGDIPFVMQTTNHQSLISSTNARSSYPS